MKPIVLTSEQALLKIARYVLDTFNTENFMNLVPEDFQYRSVKPRPFTDCGFEMETLRDDDYLRIRVYIKKSHGLNITSFKSEVEANNDGGLDETIFVYAVEFDPDTFFGLMVRANLDFCDDYLSIDALLTEDGVPILTEEDLVILHR